MTTQPHAWPAALRWERRRVVGVLVVGMILSLGPVWGLVYTIWLVFAATLDAGRSLSLQDVKQVSLSLRPTLIGLAVAPVGIAVCAWCVTSLANLRKKAMEIESGHDSHR